MASWREHAPEFEIRVVDDIDLLSLIPDFPVLDAKVPPEKRSNLVRLMLVERYGGIWMDASILLSKSLEWVPETLEALGVEVLAYASDFPGIFRHSDHSPIIENSFLAAIPGNEFIVNWRAEYQRCILSQNYINYYSGDVNYDKYTKNFIYQDSVFMGYMVCFIACQKVLMETCPNGIALVNSSDDLFYLRTATKHPFRTRELAEAVLLQSSLLTGVTKLTSGDRYWADEYINHGCFNRTSGLGRYVVIPSQDN